MAITIQHKRDTAANWTSNNPTLSAGEIGVETDTGKFKFGDGSTAWSSLGYFEAAAAAAVSSNVQGSEYCYAAGGIAWPAITHNSINKYSFTSDGNATDVGDLTAGESVSGPASFSSPTDGYATRHQSTTPYKVIEKFPFASDTNATSLGDMGIGSNYGRFMGTSFTSTDAYTVESCQSSTPAPSLSAATPSQTSGTGPGAYAMRIMKYPFSSETYSHSGGWLSDFTPFECNSGAVSSSTHGYVSPYQSSCFHPAACASYWKYPFAITDAFASRVGDILAPVCSGGNNPTMTCGRRNGGQYGYQSDSNGYFYQSDVYDVNAAVLKFPFASDTDATKVLELTCHPLSTTCRGYIGTTSSTAAGYSHGGIRRDPPYYVADDTIDKFPFASDTNASDVGDLLYAVCNNVSSNIQN